MVSHHDVNVHNIFLFSSCISTSSLFDWTNSSICNHKSNRSAVAASMYADCRDFDRIWRPTLSSFPCICNGRERPSYTNSFLAPLVKNNSCVDVHRIVCVSLSSPIWETAPSLPSNELPCRYLPERGESLQPPPGHSRVPPLYNGKIDNFAYNAFTWLPIHFFVYHMSTWDSFVKKKGLKLLPFTVVYFLAGIHYERSHRSFPFCPALFCRH